MFCTTELVTKRYRRGRQKPEYVCRCNAVPWPHRLDSIEGCYGHAFCHHGLPTPNHPEYEHRCPDCDREAYGDYLYDCWRDDG